MKRFLSTVIAFALVLGLMPTFAFAAERQVIDFTGHTGKAALEIQYEEAGWEINQSGTCSYLLKDKYTTTTYLNSDVGLYVYFDKGLSDAENVAIDFNVAESGYYDISATVGWIYNDGKIYYDGHMTSWIDGKYVGAIDTIKGKGVSKLRPLYLEEGKHTFFICADKLGNSTRYMRCAISNITLTPTTEENIKITDADVSLSTEEVVIGESITLSSLLTFANGAQADFGADSYIAKKFPTFQTTDEDVVTITASNPESINASGNTIIAVLPGDVDVIFNANLIGNGQASGSVPLKIKSAIRFSYKDDSSWNSSASSNYYMNSGTYGNNWTLETDTAYTDARQIDGTDHAARLQSSVKYVYINTYGPLTVNLDVPFAGLYDITVEHTAYQGNGKGEVYVNGEYVGTFNDNIARKDVNAVDETPLLTAELKEGENKITVVPRTSRVFPIGFKFSSVSNRETITADASISATEIERKKTAQINLSATSSDETLFDVTTGYFGKNTLNATFKSSNEKVASVSSTGVVTAIGEGEAEITVAATNPYFATPFEKKFTVTVFDNAPGDIVSTDVNVYVGATVGGTVSATGVTADKVEKVTAGKAVSVVATADEGYKFAYWKDSAGNHVSDSETYSFNAYTNTSIVAVFDSISQASEKIGVDFFDGNRAYLGFREVASGTSFKDISDKPTYGMTGYDFIGWSIENEAKITSFVRAVALYEEEGKLISGITMNGSEKKANYGDMITGDIADAKAWYRDNKLVAYGSKYTYLAWGDTNITSSTEDPVEKIPLVVLNKSGDSYMIEYDNAGFDIVDAGIIFGNEEHKEVNSCYYKAKVKDIKSHGQFTAKKSLNTKYDQSSVRGYIIFKNTDGELRVIYAD